MRPSIRVFYSVDHQCWFVADDASTHAYRVHWVYRWMWSFALLNRHQLLALCKSPMFYQPRRIPKSMIARIKGDLA